MVPVRRRPGPLEAALVAPKRVENELRLDLGFLERFFIIFGATIAVLGVFSRDPIPFAVGAITPWLMMKIINRPNMPVGVVYLLLWQWAQTFARVVQTLPDGDSLSTGLGGPSIERAYWYMLASIVTEALMLRLVLGKLPPPSPAVRNWHARWQIRDLVMVYIGSLVLSVGLAASGLLSGGLAQLVGSLVYIKALTIFVLFTNVLATGKGGKVLIILVLFETAQGFSGILADFKSVFIFLGMAAIASRIRWTFSMGLGAIVWTAVLLTLGIFWTGVKMDYRQLATGSAESQAITMSLGDRLGYLGYRAITPSSVDWNDAAYSFLIRFAYVEIFGNVIAVQESSRGQAPLQQWGDALSHVLQPRFLFPNKAALSDSDVYLKLAKADPTELVREGTSISVGYMSENFVDLGFPGMLLGIAVIGLLSAYSYRWFMTRQYLPWMVREGLVIVMVYATAQGGAEASLPKILGALIMTTGVYIGVAKFGFPRVIALLDRSAMNQRRPPPGPRRR